MTDPGLCRTDLVAVLMTVKNGDPHILTLRSGASLPSGPLKSGHRSLQKGLRAWVEQQTGFHLGHIEQLYTFADGLNDDDGRLVRISYMALTNTWSAEGDWRPVYDYFPWEDRRASEVCPLLSRIITHIRAWADAHTHRRRRCAVAFGLDGHLWNDELVLQRYELLWEAGMVTESRTPGSMILDSACMDDDYRRVLATAMSRIRARIRYTPAVFDLLPAHFTLLQLQQTMEGLAGRPMHKQNFRRLVLSQHLVSETGSYEQAGQGRPARLYRFDPAGAENCYLAGAKLPLEHLP
ncbi:NUDIX hydrolase [Acetobacter fallax]|uniref:NrtR DNA-binding winged helix domain-containing protein n=1 Tax=Acetobacter fallax TaxID=1737473 RepID=A0ABX0KG73_9PROT|nr:hypothetical protein [Acetobacter fallax]NHO32927.1 hypothetical protein [Acetobacter fallax]NHO36548.1 hypothetical protein [Acetobacter fallax]